MPRAVTGHRSASTTDRQRCVGSPGVRGRTDTIAHADVRNLLTPAGGCVEMRPLPLVVLKKECAATPGRPVKG
jgi:hypothetical protein